MAVWMAAVSEIDELADTSELSAVVPFLRDTSPRYFHSGALVESRCSPAFSTCTA